jgi:ATP-dependent Clp endopeptidase proteolytic subunit ClpP
MPVLLNGEIVLYGFVGENFWGDGFTARDVLDALAEHGRDNDVTVRINSGGGYVDDGIAIFNALKAHKGKVTVIVDSMAASSASVIAMAGEERLMRTGAMMMIHDPSGGVWGTADDMERYAKVMEKHGENLASIYAEVTGEDAGDIRDDMRAELWMTADEAVERGFATAIDKKKKAKAAAAHDYGVYAHAPDRLVALTKSKNWSRATAMKPAEGSSAPAQPGIEKETPTMTTKTEAEQSSVDTAKLVADAVTKALADSKARTKAILASDEANGREDFAEHLANDTEMSAEDAIALLAKAPKVEAKTVETKPNASTYEQRRLAAADLAKPGGSERPEASGSKINRDAIFVARRNAQKGA